MNEELKIIIKAVTEQAQKEIENVKKKLNETKKEGENSGKKLGESFSQMGKNIAIATAAVTAFTAVMVNLGKQAQEVDKGLSRLKTTFASMGGSSAQATDTYRELFGIFGEHDRAIETAQSLSRITTEADKLAEYYDILAGAAAKYGDGLQGEALAEQISETIASGKVVGDLSRVLIEAGISEEAFNSALAETASLTERELLVRQTLNSALGTTGVAYQQANAQTIAYNKSQANLNLTLASIANYTTPMLTALNNLANVLLTALAPAFKVVSAAIIVFCEWLAEAVSWIANLFGIKVAFEDTASSLGNTNSGLAQMGTNIEQNRKEAEKLKKSVMGFDELNVVGSNSSSSGSGGAGGGSSAPLQISTPSFDTSALTGAFGDFESVIEKVRTGLQAILTLVGLVAAGIAAWKLLDAYTAGKSFKGTLKSIGQYALMIAGAILLVQGYCDAWVNGIDWGNLLLILGGISLALTGVGMQFGTFGVAIGLVAAGIALIILGVQDFINNGATLENTILIIGGAVAVAVGLATAGLSVLISTIIAVVATVAAFTTAILLEEEAILSTEEAQKNLNAAKEAAAEAENGYINAVDAAESALQRLKDAEEKAGITGAELYKQVQNGTLDYANMTAEQKEVYKAYLDNEKKQKDLEESTKKLNDAKKAETLASLENEIALGKEAGSYDKCKESIIKAYEEGAISAEECRDLLAKSMSEMSTDAQKTFMEDIPGDIKEGLNPNKYETTKKKMGDWFSGVGKFFSEQIWKPVKDWWNKSVKPIFTKQWWSEKFKSVKQAFTDFWESIKKKFSEVGSTIGGAVSGAFKSAINWVLEKAIGLINGFIKTINTAIGIINNIPGVEIKKIELLEVPQLAKGGITTGSTLANIGEAGREAVLPLERNTEWMDILAERINSKQSAPSKVVLMLDGKELGYAAINSINNITKQTGTLQLTMV